MKPETVYKFIKSVTLTATTIATISMMFAVDSLLAAFCILATVSVVRIGMIAMHIF